MHADQFHTQQECSSSTMVANQLHRKGVCANRFNRCKLTRRCSENSISMRCQFAGLRLQQQLHVQPTGTEE
jgi:hypothetical protein